MNKRLFSLLAFLPVASVPIAAAATAALDHSLIVEQMSVRELMRQDTQQALKNAQHEKSGVRMGIDGGAQYAASDALKLVAIYGVGKKLLAEVTVGTRPYVYMRGQVWPVGMKASSSAYMLRDISGSCIQLERKDEAHTLCLHPSSWAAK